jgi:hypothetical protein
MSNRFVSLVLLSALTLAGEPALAATKAASSTCPGIAVALFEQKVSEKAQRFALDRAMVEPFVALWHAARRPAMPARPERVTVYALPGKPFLIGYQRGDCVIAFLSIDRQRLLQWLRPQIGWIA